MTVRHDLHKLLRKAFAPFLCVCAVIYFGYHTVQGQHGLIAYARLGQELERARLAHQEARAARERLEARVALLRPDSIDPDMLEERARDLLGLVHPHDVIIYLPQSN